ncbi:MAG: SIMPL domain-containing protein [Opitutales bacterium]|nr:SIMPL domain-containing protein [Opitutales bacterium]
MKPPTLRIRADGTILEPADQARIHIKLSAIRIGHQDATKELDQKIKGLHKAISQASLDPSELQSSGRRIQPETEYVDGRIRQIGFRATETSELIFSMGDSRFDNVLRCIWDSAATPEVHLDYELANPDGLNAHAFAAAFENARAGARALATAAGCQLGAILRIESDAEVDGAGLFIQEEVPSGSLAPLTPHSISVTRSVTVTWQLQKGA